MNSDKSATKSGLVGRYLTVLDLKMSCRALSGSVQCIKIICWGSRVPQPMRNCLESHVNSLFSNMTEIDSAPRLNAVSQDRNRLVCGKLMSQQILAQLTPTKNLQFCDKKSASVRRPLGTTCNHRDCLISHFVGQENCTYKLTHVLKLYLLTVTKIVAKCL